VTVIRTDISRFQVGIAYVQMACKTGARSECFTQLGSLVSYSILLSTLCSSRVSALSQSQAIFHIHVKHDAVMMIMAISVTVALMMIMMMEHCFVL
jgi:hypothetical protein